MAEAAMITGPVVDQCPSKLHGRIHNVREDVAVAFGAAMAEHLETFDDGGGQALGGV